MGASAYGQYSIVCYFHPREHTQMCIHMQVNRFSVVPRASIRQVNKYSHANGIIGRLPCDGITNRILHTSFQTLIHFLHRATHTYNYYSSMSDARTHRTIYKRFKQTN